MKLIYKLDKTRLVHVHVPLYYMYVKHDNVA